jgi:hypothetical protein
MPYPALGGRCWRPKSGSLANAADYVSVLNERRRPAFPPRASCRHGHAFHRCTICVSGWEAEMGLVAPRL